MTNREGHRVLVVEDDPEERADVCAALELAGDSVRAAGTVEEALVAIEEEEFCYFSFDQALPLSEKPGAKAFISGGERLTRAARALDKRHTADGDHVTPIIALTSHSDRASFATDLFEMGISTFVSKPVSANMSYFLEKRRGVLARAGREEHAKCAALARRRAVGAGEGSVSLAEPVASYEAASLEPEAEEEAGAVRQGGIAAQLGATHFGDIGVKVIDGHTVRVTCRRRRLHATYIDLGLATKTRNPSREWDVLLDVCAGHGKFRWKKYGGMTNAKQRVSVLQAKMRAAFGLEDNPFHKFRVVDGWRAKFFASSEMAEGEG